MEETHAVEGESMLVVLSFAGNHDVQTPTALHLVESIHRRTYGDGRHEIILHEKSAPANPATVQRQSLCRISQVGHGRSIGFDRCGSSM